MLVARPEDQILICAARPSLRADTTERLRQLLRPDLDWKYLLATAERHCVIPLLYCHLSNTSAGLVPVEALSQLRDADQQNTNSNLFLTGELIKLLDVLEANGVPAVPFKGPTLALQAYGNVGQRQYGDLDILVKRQDVLAVKTLLASQGFTPRPELSSAQQAALLRFDCSHNFANEKNVWVDVHWDFVAPYLSVRLDTDQLWDRLEPIAINRREVTTLSPEDLLLILCVHGFTHFWERLAWICDVASLIESRKDLEWELVLQNANRLGVRRILMLGLFIAADLLEATIPTKIWQIAKADVTVKRIAAQVREQLFAEQSASPGFLGAISNLRMRERKRDRLRSCFTLIATPRSYDWMFLALPDSLFFLYYPLRPLRLAAKYGAKLFKGSADRRTSAKGDQPRGN